MTDLVQSYLQQEPNPVYRDQIKKLALECATDELADRLEGNLRFGTAGLRAVMEGGFRRFNRVSIAKAAWALGQELLSTTTKPKVVIGYDARLNSQESAEEVASVLTGLGIEIWIFKEPVATPICAFSVTKLGMHAAAMITASHNPPHDNGLKVYADQGQQIKSPMDSHIENWMAKAPARHEMQRLEIQHQPGLRHEISSDLIDAYMHGISESAFHKASSSELQIVYTPLHGVGGKFACRALREAGFQNIHVVESQFKPDGHFPTLRFPNPEEPGVLNEAIAVAKEVKADVILANDPDADRLAVVIDDKNNWRSLTGNEIGILLGSDAIEYAQVGSKKKLVMTTIVSSQMLSRIAAANQATYLETLTGFSKIANGGLERETVNNEQFVFGYEEALGYSVGTLVRDKDGISAAVRMAELIDYLGKQNKTILDRLSELENLYGAFRSLQWSVRYEGIHALNQMNEWMKMLRRDMRSIQKLAGFQITATKEIADIVVFYAGDLLRLIIRPSGTEPKIKFYLEMREQTDKLDQVRADFEQQLAR